MSENDLKISFFEMLHHFYKFNKKRIRTHYKDLTKKYLDYNDKEINENAFLRKPQFEALEMYVFLKEFMENKSVLEIFNEWQKKEGIFAEDIFYESGSSQLTIYDTQNVNIQGMRSLLEANRAIYSNYVFSLAMGIGKTILMATCIFYEFLLSNKWPKDPRFCHNVLVFAPDKTVLQSLKEIQTFDKSLVVPPEYVKVLDSNIKFHFLEENGVTLNTLDYSDFNIIISNNQKIIVKRQHTEYGAAERLFASNTTYNPIDDILKKVYNEDEITDEGDLIFNQRFEKITRLSQIGVFVDEAHHLFGKSLEKSLYEDNDVTTSLRNTINILARRLNQKGTKIVGCYNFTGTPYVGQKVLPEVVYSYGLSEAVANKYLKEAEVRSYENVRNREFLRSVITHFWKNYGEKRYEGMLPKLAIYGTEIQEIEEIKPIIEEILYELNIDTSKILINVGDSTITKDNDIREFNNLDSVESNKQFILLVGKGKEGWNCRSLFGVALFRNPRSKIFVLQATMRCLRKITDEQQKASVYLSKDNFDTLDAELNSNFRMKIDALKKKKEDNKKEFHVKVIPPPRYITLRNIVHHYSLEEKYNTSELYFELDKIDLEKYRQKVIVQDGLLSGRTKKEDKKVHIEDDNVKYSSLMLCSEVSRYMNIIPSKIRTLICNSKEGMDKILELISMYNEIIYDVIIPKIFEYLYEIKVEKNSEEKKVLLLKTPKEEYYLFKANPELVIRKDYNVVLKNNKKSFHADTYCFDSSPEKELFLQYLDSDKVEEVYFTGMFTSNQSEFYVQYIDPETQRLRKYYPDFIAKMVAGHYEIIEVKGDNMIDNDIVQAKQQATVEVATESKMVYKMYPSSRIMSENVLENEAEYDE